MDKIHFEDKKVSAVEIHSKIKRVMITLQETKMDNKQQRAYYQLQQLSDELRR